MNIADVDALHAAGSPGPKKSKLTGQYTTVLGSPLKIDLLDGKSADERKTYPLFEGAIGYFRDALLRVAHVSWVGNQQHNPGQPLHWARGKSKDQMDCVLRHAAEVDMNDSSDFVETALASLAWRALAALQLYLEWKHGIYPPVNARTDD